MKVGARVGDRSDRLRFDPGWVWAVIELNGGTVARLGIRSGDRVVFPIFADHG